MEHRTLPVERQDHAKLGCRAYTKHRPAHRRVHKPLARGRTGLREQVLPLEPVSFNRQGYTRTERERICRLLLVRLGRPRHVGQPLRHIRQGRQGQRNPCNTHHNARLQQQRHKTPARPRGNNRRARRVHRCRKRQGAAHLQTRRHQPRAAARKRGAGETRRGIRIEKRIFRRKKKSFSLYVCAFQTKCVILRRF